MNNESLYKLSSLLKKPLCIYRRDKFVLSI